MANDDFSVIKERLTTHALGSSQYHSSLLQSRNANGSYQLCPSSVKVMEKYFQQVVKRVWETTQRENTDIDWALDNPITEACDIFAESVPKSQGNLSIHESESHSKNVPAMNNKNFVPSDHKNVFLRHFQVNVSRLAQLRSRTGSKKDSTLSAIRLSRVAKRVKVGYKDRVICMVTGCEKHAQTRCDGCCTAHFRILNSTTGNSKKVSLRRFNLYRTYFEGINTASYLFLAFHQRNNQQHIPTVKNNDLDAGLIKREYTSTLRNQRTHNPMDWSIQRRLEYGSRIYVEWNGDNNLYKATVKQTDFEAGASMLKVHYDGKKRHIFDIIPLKMVKGFINEDDVTSKETLNKTQGNIYSLSPEQKSIEFRPLSRRMKNLGAHSDFGCSDEECQEVSFINQIHVAEQSGRDANVDLCRHNTNTFPSTHSDNRSLITISPITTGQAGGDQQLFPNTQSGDIFPKLGLSSQKELLRPAALSSFSSTPLDCLDRPGAQVSLRNRAHSPKEVRAVNTLPTMNNPGVNSAFNSPRRSVRAPLFHQLYRPSTTSFSKRENFPGMRNAGGARLQDTHWCAAAPTHTRRSILQATSGSDTSAKAHDATETGSNLSRLHLHDGHEKDGAGNDESVRRQSKRKSQSISRFEELDSQHFRHRSQIEQSKSALCHCPNCSKGNLSVQGMYAHFGRAHSGKLPWEFVTFSCPFCSSTQMSSPRLFKSFREIETHVNATHPGCVILGPHPSKLPSESVQNYSNVTREINSNTGRVLRMRKTSSDGVCESSTRNCAQAQSPKVVAKKHCIQSWSKIDYPHYSCKDIDMIDEQCRAQEEIVEAAREQRIKLCRNEAEAESKMVEEERLSFQRGIRERSRLADCERIEKQRYAEKADQLMMRYQYEHRNKKRSREEIEFDHLCSRPIVFSNETTRLATRQGKSCADELCRFCKKTNDEHLRHLLLDSEVKECRAVIPVSTQNPLKVLLPSFRVIDVNADGASEIDKCEENGASAEIKKAQSRRDVSTAKRVKTEEDRLLVFKNTKRCLEFLKQYNRGMVLNAWGETRKGCRKKRAY